MSEGRVSAGGVDGGGVLVEGSVRFSDAEVMGRPVDLGDCGVWELSRIFSGSSDADAMMWAWRGGWEFFGVCVGWGLTAMGGGIAVTTVNRL